MRKAQEKGRRKHYYCLDFFPLKKKRKKKRQYRKEKINFKKNSHKKTQPKTNPRKFLAKPLRFTVEILLNAAARLPGQAIKNPKMHSSLLVRESSLYITGSPWPQCIKDR